MKWFKFYGQDFITDSKLGALNPFQRLMWVGLLCMASQDDSKSGVLKFFEEYRLVDMLGLNYEDMQGMYGTLPNETIETFCNMNLVTRHDNNTIVITNYHKKQTQQSTSTERVSAFRARIRAKSKKSSNVTDETNVTLQSNGRIDKNRIDINTYSKDFNSFWNAYPRKIGKGAAWISWKKSYVLYESISKVLESQINSPQWKKDDGQFIPHPATWLNQRRWEDEVKENKEPERTYPKIDNTPGLTPSQWEELKKKKGDIVAKFKV